MTSFTHIQMLDLFILIKYLSIWYPTRKVYFEVLVGFATHSTIIRHNCDVMVESRNSRTREAEMSPFWSKQVRGLRTRDTRQRPEGRKSLTPCRHTYINTPQELQSLAWSTGGTICHLILKRSTSRKEQDRKRKTFSLKSVQW